MEKNHGAIMCVLVALGIEEPAGESRKRVPSEIGSELRSDLGWQITWQITTPRNDR